MIYFSSISQLTLSLSHIHTHTHTHSKLRALDWDVDGPLQNSPAVVIYHPKDGNQFVNVGWAGWIATISGKLFPRKAGSLNLWQIALFVLAGMSYNGIAISEKHSDVPFSGESRSGIPFNFLMRDILQFDNTVYDAMKYVHYHSIYKALSIVSPPFSSLSLSLPPLLPIV